MTWLRAEGYDGDSNEQFIGLEAVLYRRLCSIAVCLSLQFSLSGGLTRSSASEPAIDPEKPPRPASTGREDREGDSDALIDAPVTEAQPDVQEIFRYLQNDGRATTPEAAARRESDSRPAESMPDRPGAAQAPVLVLIGVSLAALAGWGIYRARRKPR